MIGPKLTAGLYVLTFNIVDDFVYKSTALLFIPEELSEDEAQKSTSGVYSSVMGNYDDDNAIYAHYDGNYLYLQNYEGGSVTLYESTTVDLYKLF